MIGDDACLDCGADPGTPCDPGCACEDCLDNREPPEADGEAFRGVEAAAYERDQQIERQRLK